MQLPHKIEFSIIFILQRNVAVPNQPRRLGRAPWWIAEADSKRTRGGWSRKIAVAVRTGRKRRDRYVAVIKTRTTACRSASGADHICLAGNSFCNLRTI